MGYVIAAYALVVGTLLIYGLRVRAQRRALIRRAERQGDAGSAGGRAP